jgi:peptidoglycan-N-acetylglucosamine deacetylase
MFKDTRHSINLVLVTSTAIICLVISGLFIIFRASDTMGQKTILTPTLISNHNLELPSPLVATEKVSSFPAQTVQVAGLSPLPVEQRRLITHGDRTTYMVALTFDICQAEGEISGYDAEIVRVLIEHNVSATFFLGGAWIRDHPENAQELASNPLLELGNHSWSHADFSEIDAQKMYQEIQLAQEQLANLTGRQNYLFRLPYGFYTEDALDFIGENGLHTIQWDVVSGDPDPNITAPVMVDWVLQQVQPGSIIIMHANGRGWHTAEALPDIIKSLRAQGYTLVKVSNLLGITPP